MANVRVKLVCLDGAGSSPGNLDIVHYLPDHEETTVTYILKHDTDGFQFTEDIDECYGDEVEVLGELTKHSAINLVFEPLVDAISIEPPYSPQFAGLGIAKIGIPSSTEKMKHYIHLRPDDTIHFSEDSLKISVMAEIPDRTSTPQASSDVKINVADRHQDGEVQVKSSNVDSDTSDDDLDHTVTSHASKQPSAGDITPARGGENAIMETPQGHTTTNLLPEESAPYSTAYEVPTSETVPLDPVAPAESPTATSDVEMSDGSDPAATSEPLDLHTAASLAASRSYPSKRKAASIDGDEDDESAKSSKKPKVMEDQYDDDDDDGEMRPAKSTRRKTKSSSATEPLNSSPEVVVAARRSTKKRAVTSMSPPSSTTSSALTGKVPNILLSNDSPFRKGATAAFLKKQGATIIDDVKMRRANFVCVLNGDKLTTTAKVLRSLALGKLVVTENWISESKAAGKLLDPDDFVHEDLKPSINIDRRAIFQDRNLFFTKALADAYGKGWKDIQELAKEAGASHVEKGSSGDFGVFSEGRMDVICFGQAKGDLDVPRLRKSHGVKVYRKNLLTESIRKGTLDFDGEEHVLPG